MNCYFTTSSTIDALVEVGIKSRRCRVPVGFLVASVLGWEGKGVVAEGE